MTIFHIYSNWNSFHSLYIHFFYLINVFSLSHFYFCFSVHIFSADVSTFTEPMLTKHKIGADAVVAVGPAIAIATHPRQYQSTKHHREHHFSGPFFEGPLNPSDGALNVAVHLYTEGIFNCRVGMLKDKTVSVLFIAWHNIPTNHLCATVSPLPSSSLPLSGFCFLYLVLFIAVMTFIIDERNMFFVYDSRSMRARAPQLND